MRVVIINSKLYNYAGHEFHNTVALCKGLERLNIPFVIIGNEDADERLISLLKLLPYFPRFVYEALGGSGVMKIWPFLKQALKFKELLRYLFKERFALQDSDLILVHSPREWEFLGWSLFIREHYTIFQEKGIELVILTLIDYHRPSFAETLFLTQVYRFALSALNKLPIPVRIGTVSELLKLEYEKIAGLQVEVFPDLAVGTMEVPVSVEDEFIDITYLGGARYTKGFDLLVDTIEYLKTKGALLDKMRFWIQANIQPGTKVKIVQKALKKLEILSKEHENIKIVKGPLSTEDYYALVARSDIVILPYRKEFYRNLVSGPFVEALSFSKVPIIPEGTWMAYEASKYELKGITFHSGSITSLGDALIRVIADLYILKKDIEKISPLWRQYHNPDNFVRILLSKRG